MCTGYVIYIPLKWIKLARFAAPMPISLFFKLTFGAATRPVKHSVSV